MPSQSPSSVKIQTLCLTQVCAALGALVALEEEREPKKALRESVWKSAVAALEVGRCHGVNLPVDAAYKGLVALTKSPKSVLENRSADYLSLLKYLLEDGRVWEGERLASAVSLLAYAVDWNNPEVLTAVLEAPGVPENVMESPWFLPQSKLRGDWMPWFSTWGYHKMPRLTLPAFMAAHVTLKGNNRDPLQMLKLLKESHPRGGTQKGDPLISMARSAELLKAFLDMGLDPSVLHSTHGGLVLGGVLERAPLAQLPFMLDVLEASPSATTALAREIPGAVLKVLESWKSPPLPAAPAPDGGWSFLMKSDGHTAQRWSTWRRWLALGGCRTPDARLPNGDSLLLNLARAATLSDSIAKGGGVDPSCVLPLLFGAAPWAEFEKKHLSDEEKTWLRVWNLLARPEDMDKHPLLETEFPGVFGLLCSNEDDFPIRNRMILSRLVAPKLMACAEGSRVLEHLWEGLLETQVLEPLSKTEGKASSVFLDCLLEIFRFTESVTTFSPLAFKKWSAAAQAGRATWELLSGLPQELSLGVQAMLENPEASQVFSEKAPAWKEVLPLSADGRERLASLADFCRLTQALPPSEKPDSSRSPRF